MIKKKIQKLTTILTENRFAFFYNLTDRLFYFIFFVLIAKNFAVSQYGELVTIFTLCSVISTIFDLGVSNHLQREISRNIKNKNLLFNLAFRLNLFLVLPYAAFSLIFYFSFINNLLPVFLIVISINFLISQINICNKALSGIKNFKYQFVSSFFPKIIFIIIYIILVYIAKAGITTLLLSLAIFLILNLISVLYFSSKEGLYLIKVNEYNSSYKSFLKLSLPLGAAIIINLLYDKIDLLLIARLTDFNEAGFYNAAYSIFKASTLGFTFILNRGFTEFSELSDNRILLKSFIFKYSKVISIICLCLSLILFFIPDVFINLFYSTKFAESGYILKILSIALIGLGLNNLLGTVLNGRGEYKAVMIITLSMLLINILLNLVYIPMYGIKAAAIITVITEWLILAGEIIYVINLLSSKSKNAYV